MYRLEKNKMASKNSYVVPMFLKIAKDYALKNQRTALNYMCTPQTSVCKY